MTDLRRALSFTTILALTTGSLAGAQAAPKTGRDVLERMRSAYADRWYRTLTFIQRTTITDKDGKDKVEIWHESLRAAPDGPVRLRIDAGDLAEGNGVIYTADSMYIVRGGALKASRPSGNAFLPLIEGVYVQPVDRTVRDLRSTGVDLTVVSSGTWHGRAAWVVGAAAADSSKPQFWVDQERLLLVRMKLAFVPNQPLMDVDLGGYEKAGKGWLATKVAMSVGGKPAQTEEYSDWKVDVALAPELFDPARWSTAPHWARKN